jgi:hypothetical protein
MDGGTSRELVGGIQAQTTSLEKRRLAPAETLLGKMFYQKIQCIINKVTTANNQASSFSTISTQWSIAECPISLDYIGPH